MKSANSMVKFTFLALGCAVLIPAANAQPKDSLTLCQTLEPPILDPSGGAAAAIREVTYGNVFEGLVAYDRDARVVPALAREWTVSPDGLTWRFRLRPATFHDGSAMTSADVRFSFERALAPDSKNAQKWIFEPIASIATPAPDMVEITLKSYTADFLDGLAMGDATIFSAASVSKAATEPVGTGPYRFIRWQRGDRLLLERNDTWWGARPAIKSVTFRFIADAQAQVSALLAGDCDAHTNLGANEAVAQLRADPRLAVTIGRTEGETIVSINNAKAPFSDIRVRQAMAMAVDRRLVNEGAVSGLGTLIGSHFSPNHPAYVDLTAQRPVDLAKARSLLAEAGFPNGFATTLRLPPPAYARRGGEIVAAMLGQIGIRATIEPLEWPQWLERVFRNKDFDMTMIAHVEPLDVNIYARDNYYFGYQSSVVREAYARTKAARSDAERREAFQLIQRQIAEDQVNLFLFMLPKITVARKGLVGLWPNWPVPANPLAELRWE